MLFNSPYFIFLFAPTVFAVFFILGRNRAFTLAAAWLVAASFFFYAWWSVSFLLLLVLSIAFNFTIGRHAAKNILVGKRLLAKRLIFLGITANLILLGYFKYAEFLLGSLNFVAGTEWHISTIILPIGISFYTFTQIAYLVDVLNGKASEYNPIHYALFVSYFPHLVAGPILHHREMMPQFSDPGKYSLSHEDIAIGLSIFFIGLFKKVVLADGIAPYSNLGFHAASQGDSLSLIEAWGAAVAYTLQLYFDFSGYSDMAIGISRLFGIKLPANFYSPYKAQNISEFWRRWHMTLSRFLRDYLYIPLGGNRFGSTRRNINLMVTMLLGGLWHGAGWTFVVWGGLHGFYLIVNHAWATSIAGTRFEKLIDNSLWRYTMHSLTFICVVIAWVFFRADSMETAKVVLSGMSGLKGLVLPEGWLPRMGLLGEGLIYIGATSADISGSFGGRYQLAWTGLLLALVFFAPNTQEIMARYQPVLTPYSTKTEIAQSLRWTPNWRWLCIITVLAVWSTLNMNRASDFLYWQF